MSLERVHRCAALDYRGIQSVVEDLLLTSLEPFWYATLQASLAVRLNTVKCTAHASLAATQVFQCGRCV